MKRLIAILAVLCMVFSLAACNNGAPNGTEIKGTVPVVGEPGDPDAYGFTYNSIEIHLNDDMEFLLQKLGEPKKYTEEASCAFVGLDKTYTYDSFVIQTYPRDGRDYVYTIWFLDDMVKTNEGVKMKDDQAAVEAVYGTDAYNGRNAYIFKQKNYAMTIILKDGVVDSIQYTITIG